VAYTTQEHLNKISQNRDFLKEIVSASSSTADGWRITILFYNALHYIEAYFCSKGRSNQTHTSRASSIQSDPVISSLYRDYRSLENLSREARYDVTSFNSGDMRRAQAASLNIENSIKAILGIT